MESESPADALPWSRDPEVMGGQAVFTGTRVLLAALFETLERGGSLASFHDDFPVVSIETARLALLHAQERATAA